jgi:hypothetical protein
MKPTTQVTEITSALLGTLRAAINAALKPVGEAQGVSLELGTMTYSPTQATTRLTIRGLGGDPDADDFERLAHLYGLEPTDLGMEVELDGVRGTIIGLKSRARRFPILLRRADGTEVAATADEVRHALERSLRAPFGSMAIIADEVRSPARRRARSQTGSTQETRL